MGDYWPMATDLQCLMFDEPLSLQGNHLPVPSARRFWAREVSEEQKTSAYAKEEKCEKPSLHLVWPSEAHLSLPLPGNNPEEQCWTDSCASVLSCHPSTAGAPTKDSVTFKAGSSPSFFHQLYHYLSSIPEQSYNWMLYHTDFNFCSNSTPPEF